MLVLKVLKLGTVDISFPLHAIEVILQLLLLRLHLLQSCVENA
jgi:hypothetical protein